MGQRKIEMTWRCSACGTVNLGRHKVCQSCGDPKDKAEKFEMPSDTRQAASVQDPELLKLAHAGKDWSCLHCGANVSATLNACTQCGANRQGERPPIAELPPDDPPPKTGLSGCWFVLIALFGLATGGLCMGGLATWWSERPRQLTVSALNWTTAVAVERYAAYDREGFAEQRPADAIEVKNVGPRHHHDEQVLDHYETEHYTEQVLDGYNQESYQEQVACGQDCVDVPQTCSETCSDDGNGFATCTESCSGGGQSCTTRYCSETRYRDVPRYRDEPRTREVPKYRSEPRYADWFTWKRWEWADNRTLSREGSTLPVQWPADAEIALKQGLGEREDERATRSGTYKVRLADKDGRGWWMELPDEATLNTFPLGSEHKARIIDDAVQLVSEAP